MASTVAKVGFSKSTNVTKWEAKEGSAVALACSEVCWTGFTTCQKMTSTNPKQSMQKPKSWIGL